MICSGTEATVSARMRTQACTVEIVIALSAETRVPAALVMPTG